jgi:hypothetical protein
VVAAVRKNARLFTGRGGPVTIVCITSRPAKLEDKLVTTKFNITHGFATIGEPHVAVCLLAGTELAFDENVKCRPLFDIGILPSQKIGQRLAASGRSIRNSTVTHHDALEFPDG